MRENYFSGYPHYIIPCTNNPCVGNWDVQSHLLTKGYAENTGRRLTLITMDTDCEEVYVPQDVIDGINDLYHGRTATKEDIEAALKF